MNDFDWAMKAHNAVNEMDRDIPGLSGPTITFMTGAQWQRDQLRTPEAIERAAVIEFAREYGDGRGATLWGDVREDVRNHYRDEARNCINALLGED